MPQKIRSHKLDHLQKFRELGLKATPQRLAIYNEISNSSAHPSADYIYKKLNKKFRGLSFDTVNRTLLTFVETGLVRLVEGGGDTRRFDPHLEQHHHLRCIKCFQIIDFQSKHYDDIKVPSKYLHGFKLVSKKVILEGICQKCR
jgi:Fur family peroxide stress response transcriptional regulator